jgi:hypothetical protein
VALGWKIIWREKVHSPRCWTGSGFPAAWSPCTGSCCGGISPGESVDPFIDGPGLSFHYLPSDRALEIPGRDCIHHHTGGALEILSRSPSGRWRRTRMESLAKARRLLQRRAPLDELGVSDPLLIRHKWRSCIVLELMRRCATPPARRAAGVEQPEREPRLDVRRSSSMLGSGRRARGTGRICGRRRPPCSRWGSTRWTGGGRRRRRCRNRKNWLVTTDGARIVFVYPPTVTRSARGRLLLPRRRWSTTAMGGDADDSQGWWRGRDRRVSLVGVAGG